MRKINLKEGSFLPGLGESPIEHTPNVSQENGNHCIPQHYLIYMHTRETVGQLVLEIDYSVNCLICVDQDAGGIFIQVGVVGPDNYRGDARDNKIVYGRNWQVESTLPASEIIQTGFLAIKKAREHEIRERFRLKSGAYIGTPFNNHHDLP
ncbi:hypothetical protein MO867_13250 [Microbulbifer sp. OS29]|uniref:Uncharacterized protein n=1 Tax=Microbulbifer okhotskensis TaxID=2926617 RepID=A0A9X2ETK4_9GAMM|nr:hypothetical protein [Microbulbifer okhotskensis]MCO1335298.1 hypothetical protein [Microbulbifer okhotskensis]